MSLRIMSKNTKNVYCMERVQTASKIIFFSEMPNMKFLTCEGNSKKDLIVFREKKIFFFVKNEERLIL